MTAKDRLRGLSIWLMVAALFMSISAPHLDTEAGYWWAIVLLTLGILGSISSE